MKLAIVAALAALVAVASGVVIPKPAPCVEYIKDLLANPKPECAAFYEFLAALLSACDPQTLKELLPLFEAFVAKVPVTDKDMVGFVIILIGCLNEPARAVLGPICQGFLASIDVNILVGLLAEVGNLNIIAVVMFTVDGIKRADLLSALNVAFPETLLAVIVGLGEDCSKKLLVGLTGPVLQLLKGIIAKLNLGDLIGGLNIGTLLGGLSAGKPVVPKPAELTCPCKG